MFSFVRPTTTTPTGTRRLLDPRPVALGRVGAGAVLLVRPQLLPRTVGIDSATAARSSWLVQMLGAREVALGLGTLHELRRGDDRASRLWLSAGLLSDATDALVLAAAVRRGRLSRLPGLAAVALALSSVAVQGHAVFRSDPAGE